jgi:hypothetical protein
MGILIFGEFEKAKVKCPITEQYDAFTARTKK